MYPYAYDLNDLPLKFSKTKLLHQNKSTQMITNKIKFNAESMDSKLFTLEDGIFWSLLYIFFFCLHCTNVFVDFNKSKTSPTLLDDKKNI